VGGIALSLKRYVRGWGRRAAWAVLILSVALQIAAASLFDTPRLALFDLYQRTLPRHLASTPVVIVAIDDASLAAIGQWPWPRQIEAQLITNILDGHPAALGIDLLWPEPDRQSPEQWLKQAGAVPPALGDALRQLPTHDSLLRDAIAAGPVVLGIGVDAEGGEKDVGPLAPIRRIGGGDPAKVLFDFPTVLRDIPELDRAAAGHGVLSVTPDPDGVFRRLPLITLESGRLAPSLDLEMLRIAARAPLASLYLDNHAIRKISVGPLDIQTQADGDLWVDFTLHDGSRFVSAADVLAGRIPAERFDRRLVLIGETGLGQVDRRSTPLGEMPGTEIHAQLLENIIAGRLVERPNWTAIAEPAVNLIIGLLLILFVPMLRPRWQTPAAVLPLIILAGVGFVLWDQGRLLFDVATPAIAQILVFAALIGGEFAEADVQRRRLRGELELQRLASAKAEGELEAGRRIQMGILPVAASVAADHRFDLDAHMIAARHIGGDLYDFFKIDADHLFIAIGDVSGKGIPAALFMALGKSLCKSCALRGEKDIGDIINRTNAEISRDNPEMLFITMFAGILNVATGELLFSNAGHDPPLLLRTGEPPFTIASEGGPPLCVMDEFVYQTESCQLKPGDMLCLMTDGVTEAMTREGTLMGKERVEHLLADIPPGADARTATERLHAGVDRFVAGAEPSDDLTILTVRWHGPT
jgi:serine phosphatase RsbU (regulator of sigma subunit)/CHASE2 domain-containing sensor protein